MVKGEPRWRTWQLLGAVGASLVLGAAIGLSGASTDREAREDAEQRLATAEQTSADVSGRAAEDRSALDAALRATSTRPPTTTTTLPPTTLGPTTTTTPGPKTTFGDGNHRVGIDIAPGTYRSTGAGSGNCYWARLSNFTGQDDILANFLSPGPTTVTILASDEGFESRRCGTWTRT